MHTSVPRPAVRARTFLPAGSVLLALVLSGCAGDPTTSPSALVNISVAALSSRTAGFYFLPPMVKQPSTGGIFDADIATLNPRVTICDLSGPIDPECGGSATAVFTTSSAPAIVIDDGKYAVNWDTKSGGAQTGHTYRVIVTAGATGTRRVLGLADVLLTAGGNAKNDAPADVIVVQGGRTLPIKFRIERGIPGGLTVGLAPASVKTGASSIAAATLVDLHGSAITGAAVSWTASGAPASLSTTSGTTNAGGVATTNVTAGSAAGTATIQATAGDLTASANLTIGVAPTVTINQTAGQSDPTGSSPVNFTVTFSEPVIGFTNADVSTTGSTATIGAITVTGAGPYNVAIAASGNGTVVATVIAGAATNAAGIASLASTSTDNSVSIHETQPPTTTIASVILNAVDSPTITFSADAPATFHCRVDGAAYSACASPVTYAGLSPGVTHTFNVYAVDGALQTGPVASRSWLQPPPDVSGGSPYVFGAVDHTLTLTSIMLTAATPHPSYPNPQPTGRITYVQPGATVSLTVTGDFAFTGTYCPSCFTQFYIGINGYGITDIPSNGPNLCLGSAVGSTSVNVTTTFSAPSTPGVYVLNPAYSLEYSCVNTYPITRDFGAHSIAILVVLP